MITEEQRKLRRLGVGGSDISVILGLSSYKTPYQLYLEKAGLIEISNEETPLQYWGNVLELTIRKEFAKRNKVRVTTPKETIQHPFFDYFFANVDGFIPKWNAVFEAKNSSQFMSSHWGENGTDIIPMQYLVQVAFYCSVLNAPCAYIAVLIGGNDYREFKYTRDLELESRILDSAKEFWNAVITNTPPAPINQMDIKIMYPKNSPNKACTIDAEISENVKELHSMRKKIKELESIEERNRVKILDYMKDSECLMDDSGKILATWKANSKGSRIFLVKQANG
jgi:putative phage-type endonuclease